MRATWEPGCGHLPDLTIDGAPVLHAAPWRDTAEIQADRTIPVVDRRLGGTFACAPFGADDVDGGPPHGHAANGPWHLLRAAPGALRAARALARGRMTATLALRDGHPALYQTHVLDLDAPCTFAHHPMLAAAQGATLTTSPVTEALVFPTAEPGGAPLFDRPQRAVGHRLTRPGGDWNWRVYPDRPCEEFVALVHPPGPAWTAVARPARGDTILFLKRAEQLPLTCLWISNAGRAGRPWNGRHVGVLGVEDARCAGAEGFAAALSGRGMVRGVPLTFAPGRHVVPHAILRLPGVHAVRAIHAAAASLRVETKGGAVAVPFDPGHLDWPVR